MPPDISVEEHAKGETYLESLFEFLEFGKLSISSRFLSLMHLILCKSSIFSDNVGGVLSLANANMATKQHTLDSVLAIAGAVGRPSFSGKGEVFFAVPSTGPPLEGLAGVAVGGASLSTGVAGRAGLLDAEVEIGTAAGGAGVELAGGVPVGVGLPLTLGPVLAVAPRAAAAANPPGAFRAAGGT